MPALTPAWFTEARFGLFLHWGIYAAAARHEWVKSRERLTDADYQRYFDHFDPDLHDPRQWADDAWRAGMRYVVVTTKHHDGFCLWDSALTGYTAAHTRHGRDLLRPLLDAFRDRGLRIGIDFDRSPLTGWTRQTWVWVRSAGAISPGVVR